MIKDRQGEGRGAGERKKGAEEEARKGARNGAKKARNGGTQRFE